MAPGHRPAASALQPVECGPDDRREHREGAIVTRRYSATLPRWASDGAAKKRVPARETAIIASPAMWRAFTHSSWVRPLSRRRRPGWPRAPGARLRR